ncbi:MAG TPA: glycosyltransferase family 39 protein [Abditibacterium sp.]
MNPSSHLPSRHNWRHDRAFWAIFALAAVLGVVYNFVILLEYAPDEPRHMAYVRLLVDERRLPFLLPNGSEYGGAHSLHPPLYYLVLAPFFTIFRAVLGENGWHLSRLVSLAMGLASLPLFYEIAQRISANRGVARLVVAQIALLPMFGMTVGAINNDASALLAFAVFLWLLVVRFENDFSARAALWLGLALGAGSLCKATVIIADVGALVAFLVFKRGAKGVFTFPRLALFGIGAAILALPWYVRNYAMYGKFSPIESGYSSPALPDPAQGILVMMMHDNFPSLFLIANSSLFNTLWSQKDWFPETIRSQIYGVLAIFSLLALAGHALKRWRAKNADAASHDTHANASKFAAYGAFALCWAACLWMALFRHWGWAEGGRYLLIGLGGFSLFLALGWQGLVGEARLKTVLIGWSLLALSLNVVSIYWLVSYLNPTFGPK